MPLTVAQLTARLTADTSGFYRAMALANSSMVRSGGIASRVFAGIGIAAAGGLLLAVREAGNFEQSMNVLQAVSGSTGKEMAMLQQKAIDLGRDIKLPGVTARDAAEGMTQLARGGFDARQVFNAIRGTLQLGTAAQISYGEAADMTTRALKMFKLPASDAGRVANALAAAANESTATMTDMAYGLMNTGQGAKMMHVSLEETLGSLAMLVDAGLSGERAGTALNTMFYRLASPTDKAAKMMQSLGIETKDANGSFRGLQPVIQDFAKATEHMGNMQQAAMFKTIFGMRANQAMMGLLDKAGQTQKDYTKAVTGTNAAQDIAQARMKGFNGAMEKIANAVSTLALEFGLRLLPALTTAGNRFAAFIAGIDADALYDAFAAVIGPLVNLFINLFNFVRNNADWLLPLIGGIYAGIKAFAALRVAVAAFQAVQGAMAAGGFLAMLGPIGLVAIAIGALVAAFLYAYTHFEGFRTAVNNVAGALASALGPAFDTAAAAVQRFIAWFQGTAVPAISAFGGQVATAFNAVKGAITTVWGAIGPLVMGYLTVLQGIWRGGWQAISAVVPAIVQVIAGHVRMMLTILVNIIQMIASILRGDWGAAWNDAKQIVQAVWTQIQTIVRAAVSALGGVIRGGLTALVAIWTGVWNAVKAVTSALWGAIKAVVRQKVGELPGAVRSVIGAIVAAAAALGAAIKDGILGALGGLAGALKDKIVGAAKGALDAAKGFLHIGSPSRRFADEVGAPIGQGIIMGFIDGSRDLPEKMNKRLRETLEKGKQAIQSARSEFESAFSALSSAAMSAFDKQWSSYKTPAERALEQMDLEDRIRRINEAIVEAQKELNEAIAKGDSEAAAAAQRRLEDANRDAERFRLEGIAKTERALADDIIASERYKMEQRIEEMGKQWAKYGIKSGEAQQQIITLLMGYGVDYQNVGATLGNAVAMGLRDSLKNVRSAATEIATAIEKILKTKSPTEEGPMSDLNNWWNGFADTLVAGVKKDQILNALTGAIGSPSAALGGAGAAGAARLAPAGGNTNIYVTINPQGQVLAERDLVDMVAGGIREELRRTPGYLAPR